MRLKPNPDEPGLKIEDCKLNICGCRFAASFLKWKEFLKYSIFNIQSKIFQYNLLATKCKKIISKGLMRNLYEKEGGKISWANPKIKKWIFTDFLKTMRVSTSA
jgi:hypothetical protein